MKYGRMKLLCVQLQEAALNIQKMHMVVMKNSALGMKNILDQ